MSANKRAQSKKVSNPKGSIEQVSMYQGPLPHFEDLDKYNEIIPNGADRIMTMAEKEREDRNILHNRELDLRDKAITFENSERLRVLLISVVIITSFLGLCGYGFYLGFATQSASILGVSLLGIIGYLTKQKKSNN